MLFSFLRKRFGLASPARHQPARFTPRVEGLEDRTVPATFSVASGGSIQAAINAAAATADGNDVINIAKATYTGNLVIPNAANLTNLVIQTTGAPTGENNQATLKAASGTILKVDGETGVTIKALKFDGTGLAADANGFANGIAVVNGGQATIQNNFIRNISPSTAGSQGFGIRVGQSTAALPADAPGTTGTATISTNTISSYSKDGIVVRNTGSNATITGNTITGNGALNTNVTLNGIEISYGALATIYSNTVSANAYRNGNTVSVGIFLFQAGSGVQVGIVGTGNTVSNNDLGIQAMGGTSPVIQYNTVSGTTYSGISTISPDGGTTKVVGATISHNSSSNTSGGTQCDGISLQDLTSTAANPVNVNNNNSNGNTYAGFYVQHSGGPTGAFLLAANNNANGNARYGFEVVSCSGISFNGSGTSNNGSANTNSLGGYLIDTCSNVTVNAYNANSNTGNGFYVKNSTSITITNTISRANTLNGYLFENSAGLVITSNMGGGPNSTDGNLNNGFSFVNTVNSTVSGNTAQNNKWNGIKLDANSTGNTLSGNTLTSNNRANNGSFDANDQSGTATTVLNTWSNDTLGTKNKAVIS